MYKNSINIPNILKESGYDIPFNPCSVKISVYSLYTQGISITVENNNDKKYGEYICLEKNIKTKIIDNIIGKNIKI